MLTDLHIVNFRAFKELKMRGLGRVNLLVGRNNCGKTTVLEAIRLLMASSPSGVIRGILKERDEFAWEADLGDEFEIAHLFHGRELGPGTELHIKGFGSGKKYSFTSSIREISDIKGLAADKISERLSARRRRKPGSRPETAPWKAGRFALDVHSGNGSKLEFQIPLSYHDRVSDEHFDHYAESLEADEAAPRIFYLSTQGLDVREAASSFAHITLTAEEEQIIATLQILEPRIERVAISNLETYRWAERGRGGLVVRLKDSPNRIPFASLGDGMWRLLGVALALVNATGGVLLIDEIDTGLHHTTLEKMWRMIHETAKKLDVQVFATTHSGDCIRALARVVEPGRQDFSIQRIEEGRADAVAFSEAEIHEIPELDIEVR